MFNLGNFMKKILILFITMISFIGCQSYVNKNYDKPIGEFINVDIPYSTGNINVYRFNYKNHQYVYFAPYANLSEGSIVHDPDCPCLKQ